MKYLALPTALLIAVLGCTVISNDRVFPKLAPFWTREAQEQRASDRRHEADIKAYQDSQRTNTAAIK